MLQNLTRTLAADAARVTDASCARVTGRKSRERSGSVDPRDNVYELRRRAAQLRAEADDIEREAWDLDRAIRRGR